MSDHASKSGAQQVHPVDEKLPAGRLATLGMQHVLVMYAGAVAVPLIVGRALGLSPEQVAMLISADLFCCGMVTLIQSLGFGKYFGIKLPVMMGVTFAAVGPMVAMANVQGGPEGARAIFGAIIGAGLVSILIAPFMSRLLRFFPPVVTGTIIAIIGISLMRVGVGWALGGPAHLAQSVDVPQLVQMVDGARDAAAAAGTELTRLPGAIPMVDNPGYGALDTMAVAGFVLLVILLLVRFGRGFVANIAVLLGIVVGCVVAVVMGRMHFDMVAKADWFAVVTPFAFGMPTFDPVMVLTMTLVMVVVMIESVGMFLALGEITDKHITRTELAAGLRTDGLGTVIGGVFNTFPYTSFSQNVGLVGVTGVKSRWVCVAAGVIMIVLGMLPKMAALVESVPTFVLGGAGLVMFGMVAATGIRILTNVDFKSNRNNLYIVALSIGFGLVPLVAPRWTQHMAHGLHPLLESGILLTAISAVLLNLYFNGGREDRAGAIAAAKAAEAH
ncbi:nucleobase:cation symporter-2 family protein [Thauera linaloolentis]|uniref:Xanthine permease n=1 Tax=Thauera linaloolentis (strain DSM 12138 / JCM 21573 / CCUG 41526 / CIP 105981 / IAM 15112 / NBRC 102519 / 47Lol) TaxID=1123367 RepID=N6XUD9_THAL4|nr:nucleobase:cation symporter-2 family protein [Thauera linaloolentis]ENO85346.1 xanthine permease [Thauera linaloolentis 47Lol = DSM 12138]MCM8567692.1 purine permease [Thauera linaloolentis]